MAKLLELVMIVKNSGSDLAPMLRSVKPFVDSWTILDTGSSDNTTKVIEDEMKGVSGTLHQEPFVDFSTSRNRALELAGDKCIWTIMLDDTYHLTNGLSLRRELKRLKKKIQVVGGNILILTGQTLYPSTRVLRTAGKVRYKHKIHEVPDCPQGKKFAGLNTCTIMDKESNYMKQRSKARIVKDVPLLEEELVQYPGDRRILLHMGKTQIILSKLDKAREALEEIKISKKYDEYDFEARRLLYALALNDGADPLSQETVLKSLCDDHPKRAEPPYYLAFLMRSVGRIPEAFEWIMKAAALEPNGGMSIQKKIYETEIPYLAADISLVAGQMKVAEKILKTYSARNQKDNRLSNMIYAISDVAQPPGKSLGPPIIVFHATGSVRGWNGRLTAKPAAGDTKCSGSEFMTINLAESLAAMGYRLFVFGAFIGEGENGSYNTEDMIKGVQYIDQEKYWDFISQYKVDILIVSRDVSNLVYANNVKKVYLWLHDIVPVSEAAGAVAIQYHKTKFKKVICLCDWHAENVQSKYGVHDKFMAVSRNSIDTSRFDVVLPKIPFRFLYASAPDRGLQFLLKMMPRIKKEFPETTLHVFADLPPQLEEYREMKAFIESTDYIVLRGRVSQQKIAEEFLISDIWLYPTDFTETYCITALEAQAAGMLCACSALAALKEIVGDRGVTVEGDIREQEVQDNLHEALAAVLRNPDKKRELAEGGRKWAMQQGHDELAHEWRKNLFPL